MKNSDELNWRDEYEEVVFASARFGSPPAAGSGRSGSYFELH
jgi:hypothetical protein